MSLERRSDHLFTLTFIETEIGRTDIAGKLNYGHNERIVSKDVFEDILLQYESEVLQDSEFDMKKLFDEFENGENLIETTQKDTQIAAFLQDFNIGEKEKKELGKKRADFGDFEEKYNNLFETMKNLKPICYENAKAVEIVSEGIESLQEEVKLLKSKLKDFRLKF